MSSKTPGFTFRRGRKCTSHFLTAGWLPQGCGWRKKLRTQPPPVFLASGLQVSKGKKLATAVGVGGECGERGSGEFLLFGSSRPWERLNMQAGLPKAAWTLSWGMDDGEDLVTITKKGIALKYTNSSCSSVSKKQTIQSKNGQKI